MKANLLLKMLCFECGNRYEVVEEPLGVGENPWECGGTDTSCPLCGGPGEELERETARHDLDDPRL
jgi:hypothetical protein